MLYLYYPAANILQLMQDATTASSVQKSIDIFHLIHSFSPSYKIKRDYCDIGPSLSSLSGFEINWVQHCMYYSVQSPLQSVLFLFFSLQYLTNVLTVINMLILLYLCTIPQTLQGYWLLLNPHMQGMWSMDVQGPLHQGQGSSLLPHKGLWSP